VKHPFSGLPRASIVAAAVACACAGAAAVVVLDATDAAFGTLLAAAALIIAAVDLDRFEIPDAATFAMFALGVAWTQAWRLDVETLMQALLRSLVVAGALLAVRTGYRALRKVDGLGLGDVKLAGAGAAWLSYPHIAFAFAIAVGAAIAVLVGRSIAAKEPIDAQAAVPFGTFLAPAIWLAWFAQVSAT